MEIAQVRNSVEQFRVARFYVSQLHLSTEVLSVVFFDTIVVVINFQFLLRRRCECLLRNELPILETVPNVWGVSCE
jgi:hypothetical protein